MTFVSEKQRRWYFANYGKYKTNYQTANYYSASTGWIWIENLDALKDTGRTADGVIHLGSKTSDRGWMDAIKNYQSDLEKLPPAIRWLADIKTTAVLVTILTFLLTFGGSIASGTLGKGVIQGFKREAMDFMRT